MNNQEKLDRNQREREERRQIVEKYDRGREEGAVIDDWEDPKFEIYHMQDRYGFIHDQRLPEVSTRSDKEQKALDKEMSRVDKWLVMIQEKEKWFLSKSSNFKKFSERVWKGCPERMRGELWRSLLNIDKMMADNPGKYDKLRDLGRKYSKEVRQIDLDVNRTYRDHIMFRERYNIKQKDLFHVLTAYSVYNTEVSYCQGMSQIAALLLMFLTSDEEAFWGLHQLMVEQKYNMHAFFIPSFPKLQRFQDIHDKVLLKKLKKVQKHLISQNMDTGIYSIKWFLQCFLDRIPFSLTLRVWDVLLLEGDNIILAMAFNILKLHQKHVLKLDMDQLMQFFQHSLTVDFGYEDDNVMESLKDCLSDLKSAKLLPSGNIPDNERPMKPFGEFCPDIEDIDSEDHLDRGARSAVSEDDRQFHRNTLQRAEYNLRHIDSTDDIDEEDDDAKSDKSVSLTGDLSDSSVEKKDEVTPTKENINRNYNKLQDCIRELDKSFEYLMSQAEDISANAKTAKVSEPYLRPSSAGPLSRSSPRPSKDVHKRSSAYIPAPQHVTNIQVRPGPSHIPRLVNNSASSSSRDINLSSDSMGPDSGTNSRNSPHNKSQQPQYSKPPPAASPSRTPTRVSSKNYYYFGDNVNSRRQTPSPLTLTPEPKSRPRSRYFYGNSPDLTEILQTLGQEDKSDVALFDDVKTPVNDPPQLQDGHQESRLLTQEHNMKLLASAAASPSYHGPKSPKTHNKERSHSSSSDHKTYSAVNKRFGATPVRSTSERQSNTRNGGHRTTHDHYISECREYSSAPNSRYHQRSSQSHRRHGDLYYRQQQSRDTFHYSNRHNSSHEQEVWQRRTRASSQEPRKQPNRSSRHEESF